MTERQLFVDLDGVLADFDEFYFQQFGVRLPRQGSDPPGMWTNIRSHGSWFESLPMIPGALDFWTSLKPYRPTILSGLASGGPAFVEGGDAQKRRWVDRYLGADVPLITCRSKLKCMHGRPGDVLVDDWSRYRSLWEKMGGIFLLHRSYESSLASVRAIMNNDAREAQMAEHPTLNRGAAGSIPAACTNSRS